MKEEIVKKEESVELFVVNNDSMSKMLKDSETYKDNTSVDDITIPRLKLVQSATPQAKKADPSYIKGLEEGDLLDTLTNQFIKGDEGAYIVPIKRRVTFLEWVDIKAGGGLKNNFGEDPTVYDRLPRDSEGRKTREIDGIKTEIIKTHEVYAFMISKNLKEVKTIVLSLSKSHEKSMKDWNSLIRLLQDPKSGKQLPEYAGLYKVTTVPVSNDKGSWFTYKFNSAGYSLALPEIGNRIYEEAKELNKTISENKLKVQDYEGEKNEGEFIDTPKNIETKI